MSAYRPYPKYKPSGVEWLGDVPEGWEVTKLKFTAAINPSNIDKKSYEDELPISLCNYTDVYYNETITPETEFMPATATRDQIRKFSLKQYDVIITKDSEDPNDIAVPSLVAETMESVVCGYHLTLLRPTKSTDGRFLKRYFDSKTTRAYFSTRANGLTRYGLGSYPLSNANIALPPLPEQHQIATFLDRECGKLDALQAKQERLIELLKEKRQALISHAVTRGLDPTAKLKPSGIEWLGDVPEHWQEGRIKTVSRFTTSGPRGWSDRVGETGALFVQSGDLNERLEIEFASSRRVNVEGNAETSRTHLRDGDIVVCITGAKTGNVAVCDKVPEEAYINQHLCLIRPNQRVASRFVGIVLKSHLGRSYFDVSQYGLKQGLSLEDVLEAPMPLPPLAEQHAIVAHLDEKCGKIDQLKAKAERGIALLKERRSALISAAVTGKIDVRES